jgi:4-hydroxy-2-oxoheptanedioate aldolase
MARADREDTETLRGALMAGVQMLATFLLIPRLEVVEALALAGFDAIVIDLEHGPIASVDVQTLASVAQGAGMYAIARVGDNSEVEIGRVLDAGVDGILVPHVSSTSAAMQIVKSGRFPPAGDRSINPYVRGNHYGFDRAGQYERLNLSIALLAMLEGAPAVNEIESICAISELDGVFIGAVDLAASLGLSDDAEHSEVISLINQIIERVHRKGKRVGIYAPTPEAAGRWFKQGVGLVAMSTDSAMAGRSFVREREAALECAGSDANAAVT